MKKQSNLCKCGHYQSKHIPANGLWPMCMYCQTNIEHEFELDTLSLLETAAENKGLVKKSQKKDKPWHWPFQRMSDGPEYACPHGVGHSIGVHGCDGCCRDSNFPKGTQNDKKD